MLEDVVDIFEVVGLKKFDISILFDEFLDDVCYMEYCNLVVEFLECLFKNEIKVKFKINVVKKNKFFDFLEVVFNCYKVCVIEMV